MPPCHQTWSDDDSNMSHAAHGPKSCIDTICEATLLAIPNLSYFRHQPTYVRSGQRKEQTANNKDRSQWTKDLPPCHQTWSDDDSNMSHAGHVPKSCIDTICEATLLAIPNLSYFSHLPASAYHKGQRTMDQGFAAMPPNLVR